MSPCHITLSSIRMGSSAQAPDLFDLYRSLAWSQAAFGIRQNLMVADAECLDPPLLAKRQPDEEAKLHKLGIGEVLMQLLPEGLVRKGGFPDNGAGVRQRDLLALGEFVRVGEV